MSLLHETNEYQRIFREAIRRNTTEHSLASDILRATTKDQAIKAAGEAVATLEEEIQEIQTVVVGDDGNAPEKPDAPDVEALGRALAVTWSLPPLSEYVESTDVELKVVSSNATTVTQTKDLSLVVTGLLREEYEVKIRHRDRWGHVSEWSNPTDATPIGNVADEFSEELQIAAGQITGELGIEQIPDITSAEKLVEGLKDALVRMGDEDDGLYQETPLINANVLAAWTVAAGRAIIGEGTIDRARILDAAINDAKIDALAVTEGKIANLAVTNAKIANLNVSKLISGEIQATQSLKVAGELEVGRFTSNLPAGAPDTGRIFVNVGDGRGPTIDRSGFLLNSYTNGLVPPSAKPGAFFSSGPDTETGTGLQPDSMEFAGLGFIKKPGGVNEATFRGSLIVGVGQGTYQGNPHGRGGSVQIVAIPSPSASFEDGAVARIMAYSKRGIEGQAQDAVLQLDAWSSVLRVPIRNGANTAWVGYDIGIEVTRDAPNNRAQINMRAPTQFIAPVSFAGQGAIALPADTVGGGQIKDNAIGSGKIADNAIIARHIANEQILARMIPNLGIPSGKLGDIPQSKVTVPKSGGGTRDILDSFLKTTDTLGFAKHTNAHHNPEFAAKGAAKSISFRALPNGAMNAILTYRNRVRSNRDAGTTSAAAITNLQHAVLQLYHMLVDSPEMTGDAGYAAVVADAGYRDIWSLMEIVPPPSDAHFLTDRGPDIMAGATSGAYGTEPSGAWMPNQPQSITKTARMSKNLANNNVSADLSDVANGQTVLAFLITKNSAGHTYNLPAGWTDFTPAMPGSTIANHRIQVYGKTKAAADPTSRSFVATSNTPAGDFFEGVFIALDSWNGAPQRKYQWGYYGDQNPMTIGANVLTTSQQQGNDQTSSIEAREFSKGQSISVMVLNGGPNDLAWKPPQIDGLPPQSEVPFLLEVPGEVGGFYVAVLARSVESADLTPPTKIYDPEYDAVLEASGNTRWTTMLVNTRPRKMNTNEAKREANAQL